MIRVLVVDDQEMIRAGLRAILEAQPDITVVGDVADGFQALKVLDAEPSGVDVVLMDIRMPGIDGVETTKRIRQKFTPDQLRVIVLTTFEHDDYVVAALRAGANGFLGKGAGPAELAAGIRDVSAGGGVLSATATSALIGRFAETATPGIDSELAARFQSLTPRELDVVREIAAGRSNEQIAELLFVSPFTVKTHASRAMAKVGARDRAQLVAYAYQAGIASERET